MKIIINKLIRSIILQVLIAPIFACLIFINQKVFCHSKTFDSKNETVLDVYSQKIFASPENSTILNQKPKPCPEKPIVVIIPSYNNIKYYKKNLDSLLIQSQTYTNWRAIYINDCSTDGTGQAVKEYIQENKLECKIALIKNAQNMGATYNIYTAVNTCQDNEIVILLDGDDWLYGNNVLEYINSIYQDSAIWLTYGQYLYYPANQIGHCKKIPNNIIQQNAFRDYEWVSSHLKTFYAGLFKKIKKDDLMLDGKFLSMSSDLAIMFPMLEMAGKNSKFIDKILYVYNYNNPISDLQKDRSYQLYLEKYLREKEKYNALDSLSQQNISPKIEVNNNIEKPAEQTKIITEKLLEKPMVVIIPSYNNIKYYEKNLSSVANQSQTYTNWRAIYIDDCSTDGTGLAVQKYIQENRLENKITLIQNAQNMGALYNFYTAINMCQNNEIIVCLDGDDWFIDAQVLRYLNKIYQDNNTWITYGRWITYPYGQISPAEKISQSVIEQNTFRSHENWWVTSALRTFYAGLFKKIKKEDLMLDGKFFGAVHDYAIMFPMLEMAGEHVTFVQKIMYIYNRETPISDSKLRADLQEHLGKIILNKEKYTKIDKLDLL